MLLNSILFFIALHLCFLQHTAKSYVLLTANVEDLRRIAQKFVSDSLAHKIAQFIITATDNANDNSSENINRKLHKTKISAKFQDLHDIRASLQKTRFNHNNIEQNIDKENIKNTLKRSKLKPKHNTKLQRSRRIVNKSSMISNSRADKTDVTNNSLSSLEYNNADDHKDTANPNLIIDLENTEESDDSLMIKRKKNVQTIKSIEKTEEDNEEHDKDDTKHKRKEEEKPPQTKKGNTEEESNDFNYSNKLDTKSDEVTTKANITTEKQRTAFDQYVNTNYPKAKVVATSGPLDLTEISKEKDRDSLETDYD